MEWMQSLAGTMGHFGMPIFVAAFLLGSMLPIPTWPLTVAAGVMFGLTQGLAVVLLTAWAGSMIAFLLARHVLRKSLNGVMERHPRLDSIDKALADGGWRAVLLLQMSPAMPFGVQNYLLGA